MNELKTLSGDLADHLLELAGPVPPAPDAHENPAAFRAWLVEREREALADAVQTSARLQRLLKHAADLRQKISDVDIATAAVIPTFGSGELFGTGLVWGPQPKK